MAIVILEDSEVLSGENRNEILALELTRRGHEVEIFDAREHGSPRRKITDPDVAADIVYERILALSAYGLVLDLLWFDQMDYGEKVWKKLKNYGLPPIFKPVVYSQLVGSNNRAEYANRLAIPEEHVFSRNSTTIDEVADEFDELLKGKR